MSDIQDLLQQLPIDQLAQQVGASPNDVQQAVSSALPALLMGMGANAQDPAGEASLASALSGHSPSLLEGGVNVGDIDVNDGEKITRNIFGDNEQAVVSKLGASSAGGQSLISKLLPMLAPIVMAWLAGKMINVDKSQGSTQASAGSGGGILGGILGSILGGGAAAGPASTGNATSSGSVFNTPSSQSDSPSLQMPSASESDSDSSDGGLGGLGSILGGSGGGILGDLLGGLLGGGKR